MTTRVLLISSSYNGLVYSNNDVFHNVWSLESNEWRFWEDLFAFREICNESFMGLMYDFGYTCIFVVIDKNKEYAVYSS